MFGGRYFCVGSSGLWFEFSFEGWGTAGCAGGWGFSDWSWTAGSEEAVDCLDEASAGLEGALEKALARSSRALLSLSDFVFEPATTATNRLPLRRAEAAIEKPPALK